MRRCLLFQIQFRQGVDYFHRLDAHDDDEEYQVQYVAGIVVLHAPVIQVVGDGYCVILGINLHSVRYEQTKYAKRYFCNRLLAYSSPSLDLGMIIKPNLALVPAT